METTFEVDTSECLPIQPYLRKPELCRELVNSKSYIEPIRAVEYEGKYVLVDGHHRAVAAYLNDIHVEIELVEDFERERLGIKALTEIYSMEDFIDQYENTWKPDCEMAEKASIKSLAEKYDLKPKVNSKKTLLNKL